MHLRKSSIFIPSKLKIVKMVFCRLYICFFDLRERKKPSKLGSLSIWWVLVGLNYRPCAYQAHALTN